MGTGIGWRAVLFPPMDEPSPVRPNGEVPATRFENSAFSGWQSHRETRAASPGADTEVMRIAYLDVLKLCLCDLGGTTTSSVWQDHLGRLMSRELEGADLQVRALGIDWPRHGLTMVGLNRLDDLQLCIESIVRNGVEGDVVEAGTWRGGASILMRATLNTLGAHHRTVWVADSFDGFPLPADEHPDTEQLATIGFLAVPQDEVEANFARFGCEHGVKFVPGFFEETMSSLAGRRWALIRLDGDSYDATWTTLEALYPGLAPGGYLVIDDYGALKECKEAVDEFRARYGIAEPLEQVDWTCARWRRGSAPHDAAAAGHGGGAGLRAARRVRRAARAEQVTVPTIHEVMLRREKQELDRHTVELDRRIAELRQRLAAAEVEIRSLRGSPLRGPAAWLADRIRARPTR